jgi:hypothetical protein
VKLRGFAVQGYYLREEPGVLPEPFHSAGCKLVTMLIRIWVWPTSPTRRESIYAEIGPFVHDFKRILPTHTPFGDVTVILDEGLDPSRPGDLSKAWIDFGDTLDVSEILDFSSCAVLETA